MCSSEDTDGDVKDEFEPTRAFPKTAVATWYDFTEQTVQTRRRAESKDWRTLRTDVNRRFVLQRRKGYVCAQYRVAIRCAEADESNVVIPIAKLNNERDGNLFLMELQELTLDARHRAVYAYFCTTTTVPTREDLLACATL